MYWGQNHAYTGVKIISVYWTDCSGILAAVELPRPIAPPPAGKGAPLKAPYIGGKKVRVFTSFPIIVGAQN